MKRFAVAATTGALSLLLSAKSARAQNADPFFFGDEAALSAGAVVASGTDSGQVWHNPAGLAAVRKGSLSASASTFGLRFRTIPNAFRVVGNGVEQSADDLSSTDVISVPNAVVLAGRITDSITLGGGLFITNRDLRSATLDFAETSYNDNRGSVLLTEHLDLQMDGAKYHVGPSIGIQVSDALRLGGSLFATYTKQTDSATSSASLRRPGATPEADEKVFEIFSARITSSAIGLTGTFGGQYQLTKEIGLGLALRLPEIAVSSSADGSVIVAGATQNFPGVANALTYVQQNVGDFGLGGKIIAPARVLAAVAYALGPPQSFLEAGLDIAHGLPRRGSILDPQDPVINARVGARYMLSPAWVVGGGLFTDRSPTSQVGAIIGADKADYYGLTLGVSKRTPLALQKDPTPEALVLVTTLSLRAAVGFGEARSSVLALDDASVPRDGVVDITYYELMPYLGSSVVF